MLGKGRSELEEGERGMKGVGGGILKDLRCRPDPCWTVAWYLCATPPQSVSFASGRERREMSEEDIF
jgi:hypothetical protein